MRTQNFTAFRTWIKTSAFILRAAGKFGLFIGRQPVIGTAASARQEVVEGAEPVRYTELFAQFAGAVERTPPSPLQSRKSEDPIDGITFDGNCSRVE